ncbi:RNA polymerase sigma factor [Paenibacillus segetis]|uniref:RNA polymerase sigma factor n=1 Tax=Paenibacillus segetis TaxID=1325360 RepID=A0ABQ1YXF5_9BACL|nr:RNA polymerase sigma factor [Paenibacillus segetis]GGH40439.1 hypothetical protein GCM10008013_49850 [Paenibacillus segetis]
MVYDQSLKQDEAHNNFARWVQSHQSGLRQYCRSLTGCSEEADDLVQETWLKVWMVALKKGEELDINKSFLYQIASHVWIDRYRKKKITTDSLPVDEDLPNDKQIDSFNLWMAMETMVTRLPVNQRITLLLMDVFRYTAGETAELLNSTEGAVKAVLHRARMKLRTVKEISSEIDDTDTNKIEPGQSKVDEKIVYAYLEAFREQNTTALIMLMNDNSSLDVVPAMLNRRRDNQVQRVSKLVSNTTPYAIAA